MDKELQLLLDKARSNGASAQQLDDVLARYNSKKKEQPEEPFQFGVSDTELLSPSQETKKPTEDVAVDRSATVGEWFGNIWNGLSEGVTDFLYSAAESTGLTDKNILSFIEQKEEEYPDLFEAYQKSLSNTAIQENFTGDKAKELAARTAYSQYWESDPTIENEVVPFIRGERREEAVKKTGVEIPEEIKRDLDDQFWNSSLKGLMSSLPAMVASAPTGGGSFIVQSYYSREEEIAKLLSENPDLEMTESQKEAYKVTGALVEGIIEKVGLSGALKGSPALTKFVTAGVIDKALKGSKNVTKETFDRYVNESVQQVVKRVGGGTLAEAETGALQQLSDDALKAVVNSAKGQEFFEPKSVINVFKDAVYAGAQEAVGGGVISSVSLLGTSSNEKKLKDIKNEINDLKKKRDASETEAEKTIIDDVITDLTEEQEVERNISFEFYSKFSEEDINEVQSLDGQIRDVAGKYNIAKSETLKAKYKQEIDELRSRKQELENKYSETPTRYIRDGKEVSKSEFVDMINKATPEEMSTGQWGVENDTEVEQLLASRIPKVDTKEEAAVPSADEAKPIQEEGVEAPPTAVVTQEDITIEEPTKTEEVAVEEEVVEEPKKTPSIPLDADIQIQDIIEVKDSEGNPRLFARYPLKDKPIKSFFEIKQEKDGTVKRFSDKSYGPAVKTLKKRLAKEEPTAKPAPVQKVDTEAVNAEVSTNIPLKISYNRNTERAPKMGKQFGQDVEAAGTYITQKVSDFTPEGFETGSVQLKSPLVIDVTEDTQIEYKRTLSKQYGNKKGKTLSNALKKEGYDSIVTKYKDGTTGEIILLNDIDTYQAKPAPVQKVDTESIAIEESDISDALFRIEDLEDEIKIEKGNIKEAREKSKTDIAAVRKSKLSKEAKADKIQELKFELEDTVEELNGYIEGYKEDISEFKSEMRKANKRLAKLKAGPAVKAKEQLSKETKTEELEIILLDEQGARKKLTQTALSDPRNIQKGKMTVEYSDKGLTFKTKSDTGRMKENGGELFVSNKEIESIPNINKYEKGTKEYAFQVAGVIGVADQYKGDPIKLMKDSFVKPQDIGKEGTPSSKRFTPAQGAKLSKMVDNFNRIIKRIGASPVKIVFVNSPAEFKKYYEYTTGSKKETLSKASYLPLQKEIIVDLSKADMTTLAHEMLHAYVSAVKLDRKKVTLFTGIIEAELLKGSDAEVKLAKELADFRNEYIKQDVYGKGRTKEDAIIAEEFLAEYVGMMSAYADELSPAKQVSFADKIRAAVVKFLAKIGVVDKSLTVKIQNREDALNFINGFVDALQGRTEVTSKEKVLDQTQPLTDSPIEISSTDVKTSRQQIKTEGTYIKESDLVDVKKLFSDFKNKNNREPKVWIWMSDQLKRGKYSNKNTGVTTDLEGGVGFAYDKVNKAKKVAWASGLSIKTLTERVAKADFIWFMAGSEKSSFNFSKGTTKTIIAEIEAGMSKLKGTSYNGIDIKDGSYDEFANIALEILKDDKTKKWSEVKKALDKGADVVDHPLRAKIAGSLLNAGTTVKMNLPIHQFLHETLGVPKLNEYHELIRDEFLKKNNYSNGDMSLIIKPTGVEADADVHDTYPHAIIGEVIGMPSKKNYVLDVVPEASKVVISKKTGLPIEKAGAPVMIKTSVGDVGAIYEGKDLSIRDQIDWEPSLFGRDRVNNTIITRGQFLQQAVQDLLEGKITNEEYNETVKIVSEIDPIAKFFLPASNNDMQNALGKAKSKKLNVQLEDGEYVGLRLDIPAYVNSNIWVVTAHKGNGAPLTYGSVAWATDVSFGTNPKVAAFISAGKNYDLVGRYRIEEVVEEGKTVYKFFDTKTGKYYAEKGVDLTKNSYNEAGRYRADRLEKQDKATIGKMLGKWKNFEGKTKEEKDASAVKKVEEIVKIESSYPGAGRKGSPWRQIGMNPFRHSYFYDRRTGKPVVSAKEVVQIGGLVYAKDVEYADWSDDQFTVDGYKDADGQPVRFQLDTDELTKIKDKAYAEIEKGKISAPLYKKTWYQSAYNYLLRTELESKIVKLQEKKGSRVEESKKQAKEIAARIKKYAKTPKSLELANEYLTSENKKNAKEAILKLPKGQQLLNNLRIARAFIDNISNELIKDPAFDGLSDDLRLAVQDNLSTYLRTQYRFFTDKRYNIDKRRKPAIDAQADQLLAREIGLLSVMGLSPLDISKEIAKRQDGIKKEAEQMIDGYISDLNYVKYQPSKGGAGIKMPSAAFKRKKDLPDYIEQLLGKEKDPIKKFAQTSEALANILYKGRMIDGIIDIVGENSNYILDVEPISPKDKQYTKVNDPYSKLNGKWVHNEIMDMVNQKSLYSSDNPFFQSYYNLVRLSRKSKVIWNLPSSYRKNLTGGWFFVLANGVINPSFSVDFLRRTKRMFNVRGEKFQIDEETKRLAGILADKGVTGASIDANLIGFSQATYQLGLDGDENAYVERLKKVFNITSDSLSAADSWLQEKYSSIDDYTKLIIFRSEIQTYAKKLYGKEYTELNENQKDNVHEEAAERVKQSTPTFSRLPKWFNKIAALPVIAPFISFTMESIRSYSMNVANGASDIKKSQDSSLNDVQKKAYLQAGLRRLAGAGAALSLRYAIVKVMTQFFLDDEDEELADDARKLRPDWMSGHSIIPRSIDKDGNVKVYNYSTEDPYNDVSNILEGPGSWGELIGGFVGPDIAADVIMNLIKNKDIYGNSISDYSDSKINQTLDLLKYGVDKIAIPPNLSSAYRNAWLESDLPVREKSIEFFKTLGERSIIRDYKYNVINSLYQSVNKVSETRKSYLDYDNPTKRKRQLDDIRGQYDAIIAIAIAKNNLDLVRRADKAITNLDDYDQAYLLYESK